MQKQDQEVKGNKWLQSYKNIHKKIYDVSMVKPVPSEWAEKNIILPGGVSRFTGRFSYDLTPYAREVINTLSAAHPARTVAIMKGAQIGFTQGLIMPGMAYIISQDPAPILFLAGNKDLAQTSIVERFEPLLHSSGLQELIRPNVVRAKNQRTGDTSSSKEYAGGRLTVEGTQNVDKFRQISVRYIFADDFEAAPKSDKEEGSIRKLFETRATSYGNTAKIYFISTPKVKQSSNIEPVYLLGDQRHWYWSCPCCGEDITPTWSIELENGERAGIVWELDEKNMLIPESVKYRCEHCLGYFEEKEKYNLNLAGKWKPTAKPKISNYYSYYINSICAPPGFLSWVQLVEEWLEACPPNGIVNKPMLQAFMNVKLGLTWEEKGETLRVNELMKNTRNYSVGVVPDETSINDGNGDIALLTLAVDLGGIMNREVNDVRLDWEVKAHSKNGQTYSVEHGSIGTFQRKRQQSKKEFEQEGSRVKWTYDFNVQNSVWPELENLMRRDWYCESGKKIKVGLTIVDTGHFTELAMKFINSFDDLSIKGIKGRTESSFRSLNKDTAFVKRSSNVANLYTLEVNQIKDIVAENMKLREGDHGEQPEGFMNFPMPSDGLYTMRSYFSHFESERRTEDIKNDEVVGFKWEKIHSDVVNHFWDVHIYNFAAKEIFMDMLRRSDPKLKDATWSDYCELVL